MKRLVLLVIVVLAAVAGAATWLGWTQYAADRWLDADAQDPAAVEPPAGLDLPDVVLPAPLATPADPAAALAPARVRRQLARPLSDPALGRHVIAEVAPLAGGPSVFTRGDGAGIPASTTKLLSSAAALEVLGPEHTFATRVVAGGDDTIVLVGGGDPLLASEPESKRAYPQRADLVTLAQATATALQAQGRTRVRLGYDATLFTGPADNPMWEPSYVPDSVVSPITALWADQGRVPDSWSRVPDPALDAAQDFATALAAAGITVAGRPVAGQATPGAELARVESPPLREIVQHVLEASDNEAAEVLTRHVGLAVAGDPSFTGGTQAVLATLAGVGVDTAGVQLHDGSGLSRHNVVTTRALITLLQTAADPAHPRLATLLPSLPVAGFTGSLTNRMDDGPAAGRGRVRAKTGTLTAVSSLAGVATDLDGRAMAFVLLADRIAKPLEEKAEDALDSAAAALGACHCG